MNPKASDIVVQSLVTDYNNLKSKVGKLEQRVKDNEKVLMSIAVLIRDLAEKEADAPPDNNTTP